MLKYILLIILILNSNLLATTLHKYRLIGITPSNKAKHIPEEKKAISTIKSQIDINRPKKVAIPNSSVKKIFQYTKFKKISQNRSLCGICMDYKISKKIQISVDILAQIEREDNSIKIEDKKANIKVAMYL